MSLKTMATVAVSDVLLSSLKTTKFCHCDTDLYSSNSAQLLIVLRNDQSCPSSAYNKNVKFSEFASFFCCEVIFYGKAYTCLMGI